jgi:hypothetical protein
MPIQGLLNDWYRGNVSADEDGKYRGTGFGAAILKPFVDEQSIESGKQQGAVKRTITAAGENPADYDLGSGATVYDAQGAVATKRRERETTDKETGYQRTLGTIQAGQGAQLEATRSGERTAKAGIEASLQQSKDQMTLMQEKMFNEARESRLDRAERADQRADDRLMQMEMYERADRKDEKNRRRESIQALVAGLSSLGAAFAV